MHRTWIRTTIALAVVGAVRAAQAQGALDTLPPPLAGPGTIVGIVVDAAGRPLDGAEVRTRGRGTLTTRDGAFRFDGMRAATYDLTVRKLGYRFEVRTIVVGADGASARLTLTRAVSLPPVVTVAARRGLSGVVSDTSFRALPGAGVEILSDRGRATTDSSGQFYIDVRPGQYMLRVRHDGYRTQLVSVVIRRDEGRSVAIYLSQALIGSPAREAIAVSDLQRRLNRRNPVWSRLFTHEDLRAIGSNELSDVAARATGGGPITGGPCFVYIDGGPETRALWTMVTDDVELFEVYIEKPRRRTPSLSARSPRGPGSADLDALRPACGTLTFVAWMRH